MDCEKLDIECFFTEYEQVKAKIQGNEEKIDWKELSKEIPINEEIILNYEKYLDMNEIALRLALSHSENAQKLFKKYEKFFTFEDSDLNWHYLSLNNACLDLWSTERIMKYVTFYSNSTYSSYVADSDRFGERDKIKAALILETANLENISEKYQEIFWDLFVKEIHLNANDKPNQVSKFMWNYRIKFDDFKYYLPKIKDETVLKYITYNSNRYMLKYMHKNNMLNIDYVDPLYLKKFYKFFIFIGMDPIR